MAKEDEQQTSTNTYQEAFKRLENNTQRLQRGEVEVDDMFLLLSDYAKDSTICKDILEKLDKLAQTTFNDLSSNP
jgi:exonuclease VII small subunit